MLKSAVICTGLFTAVAETSTPFTPLSTTTPSPGVEEYLPTKMPMPTPPTDDHDDGYDEYGVMTMIYHLLHHASGGRMKEEAPVITDVLPGDFFDTRKTSKLGVYSGEFKLDEYGSVATDVTVYAKTSDNNVNKDDFRYLTIDVQGGTFGHWFGYYPTVKIYNGMGNAYISAYYFKPIPFEPRMSNDSNPDAMVKTTSTPEHYDGDDHDYHRVTLTAKARAEVYLPWDQTAVPCFGSAGADGAWYLIHQFNDERLHCVVFDDHKAWYSASHPKRRDPVWITSGDVILAIRKRSGYMRGYRVKSLAHGLPYIIQWRGVQRGMQSTTANIEEGCGGFCIFGDYSQMYTVDDTYRVEDSTIELSFDHSVLTTTTPYPTTVPPMTDFTPTEGPVGSTTEGPVESTPTEGPVGSTTEGPAESTPSEGPVGSTTEGPAESTPTEGPVGSTTEGPAESTPEGPVGSTTEGPVGSTTEGPVGSTTEGPVGSTTGGPVGTTTGGPVGTTTEGPVASTTEGPVVSTTEGPVVSTTEGPVGSTTEGPVGSTTEGPVGSTTEGPVGSTTEGPVGSTTEGPVGSTTEGPVGSTTEGPVGSTTEGPVGTTTEGPVASTTEGPVVSTTEGPVASTTEGPVGTTTEGPVGSTTEVPVGTTTEGPVGSTTEVPAESTPTEGPVGSTTEGPVGSTTEGPVGSTTEGPVGSTTEGPVGTTTEGPVGTTTEGPTETTILP